MEDHTCGFACFNPLTLNISHGCRLFLKAQAFWLISYLLAIGLISVHNEKKKVAEPWKIHHLCFYIPHYGFIWNSKKIINWNLEFKEKELWCIHVRPGELRWSEHRFEQMQPQLEWRRSQRGFVIRTRRATLDLSHAMVFSFLVQKKVIFLSCWPLRGLHSISRMQPSSQCFFTLYSIHIIIIIIIQTLTY